MLRSDDKTLIWRARENQGDGSPHRAEEGIGAPPADSVQIRVTNASADDKTDILATLRSSQLVFHEQVVEPPCVCPQELHQDALLRHQQETRPGHGSLN